jgi:hypothetical protein
MRAPRSAFLSTSFWKYNRINISFTEIRFRKILDPAQSQSLEAGSVILRLIDVTSRK